MEALNRRPLKTRSAVWAGATARALAKLGFTPNLVSVIGVVIALGGAAALVFAGQADGLRRGVLLGVGALCIQLRLLCNMLDGLIAVECGLKGKLGDLFNEVPDRIEDSVLLLGAGFAAMSPVGVTLGWTAALLAVFTAYLRVLGGSLGFAQDFCGPMAKQHRMFFLTLACLLGAGEVLFTEQRLILTSFLGLIIVGAVVTSVRRLIRIGRQLQNR